MTETAAAKARKVADLIWDRVAERLAGGAAALLPIGAGAKQHGLHMTMATDQVFAENFAGVVAEKADALIWPTLTYGAAFLAYAGSARLSETFQSAVTEIANALLGFGAQRVLILDTGISTLAPRSRRRLMLAIAPSLVDMSRAKASPVSPGGPSREPLSPDDPNSPNHSPSGSFGDPTLASAEKGKTILAAIVDDLMEAAA
jgi:creatinine amidohydrolase